MYTDTFDEGKNNKHVKTCPESPCGSESSEHSHSKSGVIDGSRSSMGSEGQTDIITRGERALESDKSNCSEHSNGTERILEPARSLSSSSSSESSLNDVFKVETVDFESKASRPVSKDEQKKDEQNDASSNSSSTSEDDDNSPVPTSTFVPPTVSSPVQVMDQSAGYDPNRIPSSIFARNTSLMEWSTASNESLFSIQLGNSSFSQDHAFIFNDLYKSEELTKSGELCSQPSFVISEDKKIDKENVDVEDLQKENKLEETVESEDRCNEDQLKSLHPDIICNQLNVSGRSHCSGTSTCSFAFPILIEADRLSSPKAVVPQRHSDEKPYVLPNEDASNVAPRRSRAKCCNWFWCFSWSSCWTRGRCCRCRRC